MRFTITQPKPYLVGTVRVWGLTAAGVLRSEDLRTDGTPSVGEYVTMWTTKPSRRSVLKARRKLLVKEP
jgi:hypothetical protein